MKLSGDVNEMIQNIGKEALMTQEQYGRGAWFITDNNKASYILEIDIPRAIHGNGVDQLMQMVRSYDLTSQAVVMYEVEEDWQAIAIVDIENQD